MITIFLSIRNWQKYEQNDQKLSKIIWAKSEQNFCLILVLSWLNILWAIFGNKYISAKNDINNFEFKKSTTKMSKYEQKLSKNDQKLSKIFWAEFEVRS